MDAYDRPICATRRRYLQYGPHPSSRVEENKAPPGGQSENYDLYCKQDHAKILQENVAKDSSWNTRFQTLIAQPVA